MSIQDSDDKKKIARLKRMRAIHEPDTSVHSAISSTLSDLNDKPDGSLYSIKLSDIDLDRDNVRKYDKTTPEDIISHLRGHVNLEKDKNKSEFFIGIKELAQSIKNQGLIQPIAVYEKNGRFNVMAGERRYLAHLLLEKSAIRAIVRAQEKDKIDSTLSSLIENTQRVDLSTGELYLAFLNLKKEYEKEGRELTSKILSEIISKEIRTCQIYMQILNGPDDILQRVIRNELSGKRARALILNANKPPKSFRKHSEIHLGSVTTQDFLVIKKVAETMAETGFIEVNLDIDWTSAKEVQSFWGDFFQKMSLEINDPQGN